jgi:hypothetical protein
MNVSEELEQVAVLEIWFQVTKFYCWPIPAGIQFACRPLSFTLMRNSIHGISTNRLPENQMSIDRTCLHQMLTTICFICCSVSNVVFGQESTESKSADFFQSSVLPILQQRCYECHSHAAGKAKGGLMLDSREGWVAGGDSGAAIKPGDVDGSLLIQAVRYAELMMPPVGRLPAEEILILERWVAEGAADPRKSLASAPSNMSPDSTAARNHWAFQPLQHSHSPEVQDSRWPISEIDKFVLEKLESHALHPVDDADRFTWLRRVSLDLTGLPPTPAEISEFIADESAEAFARVVDRLLESRGYGERWARHWLDLVGYADQIGTANNIFAEHAWRYRDYVIQSIQNDKPFDDFVREQLAGDLLAAAAPERRAELLTATGYLLLGDVQVVEADKAKLRIDVIDQQIDKIGKSLLGMTVACARCHDHKFDPISQRDYYAMAGILYSTESVTLAQWGVWSWPALASIPETAEQQAARVHQFNVQQERIATLKAERDSVRQKKTEFEKSATEAADDEADAATKPARDEELNALTDQLKLLDKDILHAEFFLPHEPETFAVRDISEPRDMQITIRGNAHALGSAVPRGVLSVIRGNADLTIPAGESGRRQLADWIVSPQNPLTARVTVNRIWQKLFGEGLVRSVDYWGMRGESPSHPELLDFLAHQFISSGWSQKTLLRSLALSRVYRLSSRSDAAHREADPENRLLWRMNPRRIDAEAIRDSMLAVSGQLKSSAGGPGLPLEYPENTGGLAKGDVNPPSFQLKKFRPQQSSERTVYLPVIRSAPQAGPGEIRNVFDFAQPAEFTGQRAVTAVPTQSLFLMNGELLKTLSKALAERMLTLHAQETDDNRLENLWLLVLNRPITNFDRADALAFLAEAESELPAAATDSAKLTAWTELCHALLASNEFLIRM